MPQLNPDTIIHGRYQLQRPLGRGGFSIVWLALDLGDKNKPVALKISLPDKDPAGEQPIRMEKQHSTTRHLEHKHLLRSNHFFMVEDAGCLVFDYMAGGTLHNRVRTNGALPESEITKVIRQVGSALQYLHEHALVHFDVKPENILIDAHGDYFLSDFDTASRLENSMVRVSRIYADTPQYRSPEHLRGASELSEKVDIFAFGTTIFEMCEGMMEKELGIGMMLLSGAKKPELTEGNYAKRLENLIHACWNNSPADRPTADALVSYASHVAQNNFWPAIQEFNPNDKSVADLPGGRGTETARVTVGRPTVLNTPPTPPPPTPIAPPPPEPEKRMPTISPYKDQPKPEPHADVKPPQDVPKFVPPAPVIKPKEEKPKKAAAAKSDNNYMKIGLSILIGIAVLAAAIFFIRKSMLNRSFKNYFEQSVSLAAQNKLKDAYDAINLAREINPEDSAAIKQRREILRMALEQHTSDLDQVRSTLEAKDDSMYADLCTLLAGHRDNASILRGDDSTVYYMALIPGCAGGEVVTTNPSTTENDGFESNPPSNTTNYSDNKTIEKNPVSSNPTPTTSNNNSQQVAVNTTTNAPTPEELAEAEERRKIKEELNDWNAAKRKNSIDGYNEYLGRWPGGVHAGDAQQQIQKLNAPPPVVEDSEESKNLTGTKVAGLPVSERDQSCKKPSEGGTILLTPSTTVELSELVLFSDSPGKVQIVLEDASGRKLGSTRGAVSAGVRAQITLADLGERLKKGKTYRLTITPLRNDRGALPALENMRDCNPTQRSDSNLRIDYQGNYIIFDLKYHY